jgi:hypothetical protein
LKLKDNIHNNWMIGYTPGYRVRASCR